MKPFSHEYYMKKALEGAESAYKEEEIPIGAVIVYQDHIIARGHNMTVKLNDATAHAEMIAITAASEYLNSRYLNECTIYVTLEPCPMCASALQWSQMGRLVYGASDPKRGFSVLKNKLLHPKTEVVKGISEEECENLLNKFFEQLRKDK